MEVELKIKDMFEMFEMEFIGVKNPPLELKLRLLFASHDGR